MKILVLGGDGYLGWPTSMHFAMRGHEVLIVDNCAKRSWEMQSGGKPLWPVPDLYDRTKLFKKMADKEIKFLIGDVTHHYFMYDEVFKEFKPDVIIHFAEQPSAPFSMSSARRAWFTQQNNVLSTLVILHAMHEFAPEAHLIKLGTMGEYGTPNIDIEEGWLDIEHNGRKDKVIYPKRAGSWYHLSKVHDSHNIEFACRVWGLRATDLNQGVVYGIDTEETALHPALLTSFHYDEIFGTVINRFCVQAAAGKDLTVYGKGGQTRGFLNIKDTLACVELAATNPPKKGEFRVFNQFTEIFRIWQLAKMVQISARKMGISISVQHWDNPRVEAEEHYYNAKNTSLLSLGLKPHLLTEEILSEMILRIKKVKHLIDHELIPPKTKWNK